MKNNLKINKIWWAKYNNKLNKIEEHMTEKQQILWRVREDFPEKVTKKSEIFLPPSTSNSHEKSSKLL